jgi:hypothetical protein
MTILVWIGIGLVGLVALLLMIAAFAEERAVHQGR